MYALEKGLDDNVPNELRKDTVCQEQQTVHGKVPDPNGIVNSGCLATVTPDLGSVYALQFKLMQANLETMGKNLEQHGAELIPFEPAEHDIVSKEVRELETQPVACASGTGSPMQIQINVPLRTPNQVLHDIITHKELPDDIQNNLIDQQLQYEGEGDDESTAENFKAVSREGDLSPKSAGKSGRKGKKNQPKEPSQPTRILPRRAASGVSR